GAAAGRHGVVAAEGEDLPGGSGAHHSVVAVARLEVLDVRVDVRALTRRPVVCHVVERHREVRQLGGAQQCRLPAEYLDEVEAVAATQVVGPGTGIDHVVTGAAVNGVGAVQAAEDEVVAPSGADHVDPGAALDPILAGPAGQGVVPGPARQVGPGHRRGGEDVVPGAAVQLVDGRADV